MYIDNKQYISSARPIVSVPSPSSSSYASVPSSVPSSSVHRPSVRRPAVPPSRRPSVVVCPSYVSTPRKRTASHRSMLWSLFW